MWKGTDVGVGDAAELGRIEDPSSSQKVDFCAKPVWLKANSSYEKP